MICPMCGKDFQPVDAQQKYCSAKCGREYRQKYGQGYLRQLSFTCAQCGRLIVIEDAKDKRTRFCSHECEKKYWRHPHYENEAVRTNFRNVSELAAWEKKTNEV